MSAIKELSKYYSEDEHRVATVFKNLETGTYFASVISDAGTSFRADFDSADKAEEFAEDWVLNK
jgi:hypothetical protein